MKAGTGQMPLSRRNFSLQIFTRSRKVNVFHSSSLLIGNSVIFRKPGPSPRSFGRSFSIARLAPFDVFLRKYEDLLRLSHRQPCSLKKKKIDNGMNKRIPQTIYFDFMCQVAQLEHPTATPITKLKALGWACLMSKCSRWGRNMWKSKKTITIQ